MKKIIFVVLGLGFLLVVFLIGRNLIGQKPKQAALQISATPRSTVFLDGKHVGQTPYYDEKLKPGEYVVKLLPDIEATASTPWSYKIKLTPETMTAISREFGKTEEESSGVILSLEFLGKNKDPELAILVRPESAEVKIDGDFKGTTPLSLSDIKEGEHEIYLSQKIYEEKRVRIKLVKGYRLIANVDLAKKTGGDNLTPTPSLKITTIPNKDKKLPTPTIVEEETATESAKKLTVGEKIVIKETETGWLRVRMEPSINASEAAKVNPGQEFTLLEEKSGWAKIEYETGKEGWVSSIYVSPK